MMPRYIITPETALRNHSCVSRDASHLSTFNIFYSGTRTIVVVPLEMLSNQESAL